MPPFPPPITSILTTLLNQLKSILGSDLVGLYLRGSLATGDFEPERSDVDLLVVTETAVDGAQFSRLKSLHDQIVTSNNPYANRLEIAYIDRQSLRLFQPGHRHPTLGQGESLSWQVHSANWLLERWMLRQHGKALTGPDPETLVDPINSGDLKQAVSSRVGDWVEWALDEEDPDWHLPLSHKAFAIETMCRILYTSRHGKVANKAVSVTWALESIPEPWRELVRRSRDWRLESRVDTSINHEVRSFILWTARQVKEIARNDSASEEAG